MMREAGCIVLCGRFWLLDTEETMNDSARSLRQFKAVDQIFWSVFLWKGYEELISYLM